MMRVTLVGRELEGFDLGLPAASVRLLLPPFGASEVVIPTWSGNEFLFDDGSRPVIRTLTPLAFDAERFELKVEIVSHGHGPLSNWVDEAVPGDRVGIAGTGRGYEIDPSADSFLIAGDESALPAISVLLAALPDGAKPQVIVELADPEAELQLPSHPGTTLEWLEGLIDAPPGDALVGAVAAAALDPDVRVWAAGEAAAMQRIRRHLFDERHLTRSHVVVRGYWKRGSRPTSMGATDA